MFIAVGFVGTVSLIWMTEFGGPNLRPCMKSLPASLLHLDMCPMGKRRSSRPSSISQPLRSFALKSPVPLTTTVAPSTTQAKASDWEDVGMDILIEEEVADDGPPVLTLQQVVSVKPVVDEVPVEVPGDSRTVQCAAMNLLATAGFQDVTLEDEPQQDPIACLQALTKRVRAALGHDTPSPVPPGEGPLKKPKMSSNFAAAHSSPSSPALLPFRTPPSPVFPSPPPVVPVPKNKVLVQIPHTLPTPPSPVTPPTLSTCPALLPSPSVTPAPEQTIGVCSVPSPPTRASLVFTRPVGTFEEALDLSHHSRTRKPSLCQSTITTLPVITPPAMTPQWAFQRRPLTCTCRYHCTCGACCPCQCVCQPK